jgi:TolB-like protein/DNA-binding winged helix-turn-helix (wHTH) protein
MEANDQIAAELANSDPVSIGKWTFHADTLLLECGGNSVKLEPRVAYLLCYLAEKAGSPVSRVELTDHVWSGLVVGDEALTGAINKLRNAFGDDSHHPEVIKTIPKVGYQLIAEVEFSTSKEAKDKHGAAASKRFALASYTLIAIFIVAGSFFLIERVVTPETPAVFEQRDKPTIAVLPFTNMSSDAEQEYFADGMTEDLITDISKISGLKVIARHSTFSYKGQNPDLIDVGVALGATHVIDGSVRKSGSTVRITIQLIDASDGKHVWAERYDRELRDVFSIQDEVIGEIITALSLKLTPEEEKRVAKHNTLNLDAYDLFMRGRQQESFFTKESFIEAKRYYEQVVTLDPNYVEAWARLAQIHTLNGQLGWEGDVKAADQRALHLVEKAIAIDPENPFSRFSYARILARDSIGRHDQALEEARKAVALDPNFADAYAYIGQLHVFLGHAERAIEPITIAMHINPGFPFWYDITLGQAKFYLRDFETAVEYMEKGLERNPNVSFMRIIYAAALAMNGQQDDAEWELEELHTQGFNKTLDQLIAETNLQDPGYKALFRKGLEKAGM